jgi:hypothetical protein
MRGRSLRVLDFVRIGPHQKNSDFDNQRLTKEKTPDFGKKRPKKAVS